MGNIVSISNTRTKHVLSKNEGVLHEIGSVSNYTRVGCDRYVRQHYYDQTTKMVLPVINRVEFDGLRLITSDETTNAPVGMTSEVTAPIHGHQYTHETHGQVETPGAFAYFGESGNITNQNKIISFTNRGNFYGDALGSGSDRNYNERFFYYPPNGTTSTYNPNDFEALLCQLPPDGFNVYDLTVINNEHVNPSFYHVSLLRELEFVFHREIYPPFRPYLIPVPNSYPTVYVPVFGDANLKSTYEFIGDVAPQFFYLDGYAYRPFPRSRPDTAVLYRPTLDRLTDFSATGCTISTDRMPMMYSYTHSPVKTTAIAANLSFIPGADKREEPEEIYRYAPVWFQWYSAAPLAMTRDVVFTDAKNGVYPTKGKLLRVELGSGCVVPFVFSGHPSTSMLIPLRLVWDVMKDYESSDKPSDFLTTYAYVSDDKKSLISYAGKPSHFPLLRFECEFLHNETPTHVEVIPAMNATMDGDALPKERLTKFPFIADNNFTLVDADSFLAMCSSSYGSGLGYGSVDNNPIMPHRVLLEGKLKANDRWEILDSIELPFTYDSLPYPLYRLAYRRKIKYVRFTILSIYMSLENYPNMKYTHLYFPKMDFFTNPKV